MPEYYIHGGKPHYNYGNKIAHSDAYKKFFGPIRTRFDHIDPNDEV